MWVYSQSAAKLTHNGATFQGYSGTGAGRNNAKMQAAVAVGPIPQGKYTIGQGYQSPHLGPVVMNLDPEVGTDTFGRSLFRIHGNNSRNDASHGCIILDRPTRDLIAASQDRELEVVP